MFFCKTMFAQSKRSFATMTLSWLLRAVQSLTSQVKHLPKPGRNIWKNSPKLPFYGELVNLPAPLKRIPGETSLETVRRYLPGAQLLASVASTLVQVGRPHHRTRRTWWTRVAKMLRHDGKKSSRRMLSIKFMAVLLVFSDLFDAKLLKDLRDQCHWM